MIQKFTIWNLSPRERFCREESLFSGEVPKCKFHFPLSLGKKEVLHFGIKDFSQGRKKEVLHFGIKDFSQGRKKEVLHFGIISPGKKEVLHFGIKDFSQGRKKEVLHFGKKVPKCKIFSPQIKCGS